MNIGIIAEYNPFHKGHRLHIDNTRALTNAESIIALMSGSFVQRGEPAILDKFTRTRAALLNGVDMVLELPVEYATGSADIFAMGAVATLEATGITDGLSFGTETGDIRPFKEAAELLNEESPKFRELLSKELNGGNTYPLARLNALSQLTGRDMSFLSKPNNILALEYLRALNRLNSKITPLTVKRQVSSYNSSAMTGELSSAMAIRHSLLNDQLDIAMAAVPPNTRELFNTIKEKAPTIDSYTMVLKYILLNTDINTLKETDDISEGLENRILACNEASISSMADAIKSKRYTHSRIRRVLLHILLNIAKADAAARPKYIRVLGFKREKAYLVSQLTKKAALPVITNVKNAPLGLLDKEIFATDMYFMPLTGERGKDYTEGMIIV